MKRTILILSLFIILSLACSLSGLIGGGDDTATQNEPPQSENRCGDRVCDGPENTNNCPEDCNAAISDTSETAKPVEENVASIGEAEYGILYQIVENALTSNEMNGTTCYMFNFRQFLDAGYVNINGSENKILELKDHPISMVTSKLYDTFYYISSPVDPIKKVYGFEIFDWDVENQVLWASDFAQNKPLEFATFSSDKFPGGVRTSPENKYLLYLETQTSDADKKQPGGFPTNWLNPYIADSSLVVADLKKGGETSLFSGNYNRQLFTSFSDFSVDGNSFYTIAREGGSFKFIEISLETGQVTDFAKIFPGFDWNQLNWDEFFPKTNDFAYASFTISPDEKRIIAYKNIFSADLDNPCYTEGTHHLWVFNLDENTIESFKNQPGYVSDADWKFDSSAFALAIMGNCGCYPDYLDARIDILDKNGKNSSTLVNEPKSKITHLGWSPDGNFIIYDIYSTDFVGRIKRVDVVTQQVDEIINTQLLGYEVNPSKPIALLFADWVSIK